MVNTEHQKARQEPEACDLPTKLKKNDTSPSSRKLYFAVENFIYKLSCL